MHKTSLRPYDLIFYFYRMNPFINKKKVRGWKRQVAKINSWYHQVKTPDLSLLDEYRDEYVKIWIDPWYRLKKRNPPIWYFKLILDKFQSIFDDWEKAYKEYSKPYDLQIWLFDNSYISSEVVCAPVDKEGELRDNYFYDCDQSIEFPEWKYQSTHFDPSKFSWLRRAHKWQQYEKLDELTNEEIQELISEGYEKEIVFKGEKNENVCYSKVVDYVWVGRLKK